MWLPVGLQAPGALSWLLPGTGLRMPCSLPPRAGCPGPPCCCRQPWASRMGLVVSTWITGNCRVRDAHSVSQSRAGKRWASWGTVFQGQPLPLPESQRQLPFLHRALPRQGHESESSREDGQLGVTRAEGGRLPAVRAPGSTAFRNAASGTEPPGGTHLWFEMARRPVRSASTHNGLEPRTGAPRGREERHVDVMEWGREGAAPRVHPRVGVCTVRTLGSHRLNRKLEALGCLGQMGRKSRCWLLCRLRVEPRIVVARDHGRAPGACSGVGSLPVDRLGLLLGCSVWDRDSSANPRADLSPATHWLSLGEHQGLS